MHRNTHPRTRTRRLIASLVVVASLGITASAHAADTDDPYVAEILHSRPVPVAVVATAAAPRWGKLPETQLRVALGWTALSGMFISEMSAPSLEASLAWRFRGVSERLGLRLSAFVAGSIKTHQSAQPVAGTSNTYDDSAPSPLALGTNLSLEVNWPGGFFITPGLGVLHYRGKLRNTHIFADCNCNDAEDCRNCETSVGSLTLPEMTLALGWEFTITKTFALVVAAEGGFAVVAARGAVYAGAVLNF